MTHSIALYMLNCLHQEAGEGRWPLFNIVYNIESSMEQMDVDGYGRIKPKDIGLTTGYQHYSILSSFCIPVI